MKNNIDVPEYAILHFEKVRKSGKTNMYDCNTVLYYMYEMGLYKSVVWLGKEKGEKVVCDKEKYSALLKAYSDNYKLMDMLSK